MEANTERVIEPGKKYRHFKGNFYRVLHIARYSEDQSLLVVYQALYGEHGIWVRPYDMFNSEVDHVKYPEVTQKYRFEEVPEDTEE